MWSGFPSHMISTNSPPNLSLAYLSLGAFAFKYAHVTSKIATSRPSYESTTKAEISASRDIADNEASSLVIGPLCVLTSSHINPLILPHRFYLTRLTALSDFCFWLGVSTKGGLGSTTFISSICIYSFTMAATARSLNNLITFFAEIVWTWH